MSLIIPGQALQCFCFGIYTHDTVLTREKGKEKKSTRLS